MTAAKRVTANAKRSVTKVARKRMASTKPAVTIVASKSSVKPVPIKQAKAHSKIKLAKVKMERDSFTMPKDEHAQLSLLKARLAELGQPVKKSELLRAGIKVLTSMTDARLAAALAAVPVIKTGRPKKG